METVIEKVTQNNFDGFWTMFDKRWAEFGSTVFYIHPFQGFFSKQFADELTDEIARCPLNGRFAERGNRGHQEPLFDESDPFHNPDDSTSELLVSHDVTTAVHVSGPSAHKRHSHRLQGINHSQLTQFPPGEGISSPFASGGRLIPIDETP